MEVSNRRRWASLAVLSLALAIIIIDTTLINVSLRTIVKDLGTSVQTLQWVITGYALVVSAFTIAGGRMGDLFGRKRMFILGAIVFAAGSATAATAHSATQLILGASLIEGLGAALMMPATASILVSTFHGRERAIAFGIWGGIAGAAASFGPLLGGYLTTNFSWRWGYTINLGVVALLLLTSWVIKESRENIKRPSIDYLGIFLSSLGLASIVYGIVESSTYGWIKAKETSSLFGHAVNLGDYSIVIFALVFGFMLLIMFALWQRILELRGKTPVVSPHLFANRGFTSGVLTMAIVAMGQFGMFFTLPVFLQGARGLNAFDTGIALMPFSLSVLLAAPLSAGLGAKFFGPKRMVVAGLIIGTAGLVYIRHLITGDATAHDLIPAMIVNGIGFGMAFSQLANITLSSVSVQEAGEASGINNTFRQLGATLGTAIMGALLISAVQSGIADGIKNSSVIPDLVKPKILSTVKAQVQSLGESGPASSGGRLPQNVTDEITHIRNNALANGVREALAYGSGVLVFGILISLLLPKKIGPTAPAAAEAPVPMTPTEPAAQDAPSKPAPRAKAKPTPKPARKPLQL